MFTDDGSEATGVLLNACLAYRRLQGLLPGGRIQKPYIKMRDEDHCDYDPFSV